MFWYPKPSCLHVRKGIFPQSLTPSIFLFWVPRWYYSTNGSQTCRSEAMTFSQINCVKPRREIHLQLLCLLRLLPPHLLLSAWTCCSHPTCWVSWGPCHSFSTTRSIHDPTSCSCFSVCCSSLACSAGHSVAGSDCVTISRSIESIHNPAPCASSGFCSWLGDLQSNSGSGCSTGYRECLNFWFRYFEFSGTSLAVRTTGLPQSRTPAGTCLV